MKTYRNAMLIFLIATLIFACGGAPSEKTLSEEDVLMTYSVGTIVSGFFATQTAMVTPPAENTITPPPTNTFLPTPSPYNTSLSLATWTPVPIFFTSTPNLALTPSVTGTPPTATVNAGALGFGCNNLTFVRDANYPPGTTVTVGEAFVKTWKVENTGSCDWMGHYTLTIVSDDHFDSSWNKLGRVVKPGQWAELSVFVDAPKSGGTYTAYWRLTDGSNAFGATLGLTVVVIE